MHHRGRHKMQKTEQCSFEKPDEVREFAHGKCRGRVPVTWWLAPLWWFWAP
jgi:hypothetical protein